MIIIFFSTDSPLALHHLLLKTHAQLSCNVGKLKPVTFSHPYFVHKSRPLFSRIGCLDLQAVHRLDAENIYRFDFYIVLYPLGMKKYFSKSFIYLFNDECGSDLSPQALYRYRTRPLNCPIIRMLVVVLANYK